VFCSTQGTPVCRATSCDSSSAWCGTSGLPEIRFHDLRHTHGTMLLEAGEPAKIGQDRLGHAQVTTTLDTYSHVSADLQDRASAAVESFLKGASE